jgi:hypothetical protein
MIDAMIDAGLTREQMAALIKHELAKQAAAKAEKRANDAARQRKSRASRNVTVTPRDNCDAPSLKDPLPNLETVEVNPNPPPYSPPALEKPDLGFGEFWQAYPRRLGTNSRKNAEARFRAAVKAGSDAEAIIDGARRYAAQCDATGKTGTEFVKAAEAWLNGRFWEGSYPLSAPSRAPPPRQARRNTGLEGLDELERRFTNGQHQAPLRIVG